MNAKIHVTETRHRRGGGVARGQERVGIEVKAQAVVSPVHRREQIPLIPADAGHALEEGEDVDADNPEFFATDQTPPYTAQACTKSAHQITQNVKKEDRR